MAAVRGGEADADGRELVVGDGALALGPGVAAESAGGGAEDALPDGAGPGLPAASLNCWTTLSGTLAAEGLAARHQTSDQVEAPRLRQRCAKP